MALINHEHDRISFHEHVVYVVGRVDREMVRRE
jgi:hypothetical protein